MMDKKLFDDAIGEVPPSTVDVGAAITRGRRAARTRMVANPTVGVAAAVLLVVGAVAFALLPGPTVPPAVTSSPEPTPNRDGRCGFEMEPKTDEPADVAKERLTNLVGELVGDRIPSGARLISDDAAMGPEYGPLVFSQPNAQLPEDRLDEIDCDPDLFFAYNALADVELDGKRALLAMNVATGELPTERCVRDDKVTAQPVCDVFTGAGGERVQARTEMLNDTWVQNVVWVNKPDGTVIDITVGKQNMFRTSAWPQPPLNLDQAVEIALDPGMTLFP